MVVFLTIVAAAWILFMLYSDKRREEIRAEQRKMAETIVVDVPEPVIRPAQPSKLDILVQDQLSAVGSTGSDSLIILGEIVQGGTIRKFEDYWSPPNKMRRELSANNQVDEVLIYDGKDFWKVTPEAKTNITDTPQAALFTLDTLIYEPFASYDEEQRYYRLLFDENFGGRNNRVIGYRLPGELEMRHFFDEKNLYEVRRLAWLVGEKDGQRDIRFEKYETEKSRTFPRLITYISKGKAVKIVKIEEVQVIADLPDSTFAPILSLNK